MNITKHFNTDKAFLNNIVITIFFGIIVNLLNYVFTVFLARNLIDVDFGLYNASLGIITLVQIPVIAIQTAITKKVASNKNFNLSKFKLKSLTQLLGIGVVVSLLFFALGGYISDIANIPTTYIPVLTLVVFTAIVTPVAKGFLLGLEKILSFNLIALLETLLKFVFGFVAIYLDAGMIVIILSFALPQLLSSIFVLPFVKTKSSISSDKEIKLNYKQILLIFLTFLLLNIPFTLDLILVNPDIRASYGALSLLGKIVYFASITIGSLMISKLANSKKELRKKTLLISIAVAGLTGICITIAYMFFSKEIVDIVFNGMYLEISKYLVLYSLTMASYGVSYMVITSLLIDDSYVHILFLVLISILQVVLYSVKNSTLYDAFLNQVIIYSVLTSFTIFILIFYIFKNGKKNPKRET